MRNFDDIPNIVIEKKRQESAEPPMNAISVSQKGVFTFNSRLKKDLIDSSEGNDIWALIKAIDGELYIRLLSSDPKLDNSAKVNKKSGVFSAKTILNNTESLPKLKSYLSGKIAKTIRFEENGGHPRKMNFPLLEVDDMRKTIMLDTNTITD